MSWDGIDELRRATSAAQEKILQRKLCTSCQTMQPLEGGALRTMANGRMRWACKTCMAIYRKRRA